MPHEEVRSVSTLYNPSDAKKKSVIRRQDIEKDRRELDRGHFKNALSKEDVVPKMITTKPPSNAA